MPAACTRACVGPWVRDDFSSSKNDVVKRRKKRTEQPPKITKRNFVPVRLTATGPSNVVSATFAHLRLELLQSMAARQALQIPYQEPSAEFESHRPREDPCKQDERLHGPKRAAASLQA